MKVLVVGLVIPAMPAITMAVTGIEMISHLAVIATPAADNAMQTTATFDNSTLMGDVFFSSNFDENFFPHGRDSIVMLTVM